jgi:hypothetical protein
VNTYDAVEQAYEVHRSIPYAIRSSDAPRVWRNGVVVAPRLVGDLIERLRNCQAEIDSGGLSEPTHISKIVAALLRNGLPVLGPRIEVFIHEDLQQLLAAGTFPQQVSSLPAVIPLDVALSKAESLGYVTPATVVTYGPIDEAGQNAFRAAQEISVRRVSPRVLYFTSPFVVPDPLSTIRTPHIFDQLWVSRDEVRPNGVRLLAFHLQRGERMMSIERRQDRGFGMMGYETFRAAAWWARVDPQRVLHEFLELAGIPTSDRFRRPYPGDTINDYRCADCRGPMIRTPAGYGIVHHRERFVHEECFNRAVDEGF